MRVCILFFLFLQSTFAMQVWEGKRILMADSLTSLVPLSVEFESASYRAQITSSIGSGRGNFSIQENTVTIMLDVPIVEGGYPTLNNPYIDRIDQWFTETKIKEYVLIQNMSGLFTIRENIEVCHHFTNPQNDDFLSIDCHEDEIEHIFPYDVIKEVRKVSADITKGNLVALPTLYRRYSLVEMGEEKMVKTIVSPPGQAPIVTLERNGKGQIVTNLSDGARIIYTRLANQVGEQFVVGEVFDKDGKSLRLEKGILAVKDSKTNLGSLYGGFDLIHTGTNTLSSDEIVLNFKENSVGMTSYFFEDDSYQIKFWSKEVQNDEVVLTRWLSQDTGAWQPIDNANDFQKCITSETNCLDYSKRNFQVLSVTNNKVIVFRTIERRSSPNQYSPFEVISSGVQILQRQ